jgi:hypothetical protein
MFWKRTKLWFQYAGHHPWQAVGLIILGAIPIAMFHLAQRQVEVWEDVFLDKHGTSFLATAFAVSVEFVAKHPVWSILAFALAVMLGLLVHAYYVTHPFHKYAETEGEEGKCSDEQSLSGQNESRRDVELTPSEGQSPRLFLAVTNNDRKQKFHAQCRILECRNDPNPQPRTLLDLGWWNRSEREIILSTGDSCKLLIAEAGDITDKDGWVTEWIKIVGIGEYIENRFSRGSATPPEYDVEISIVGDAGDERYVAHFTVKPDS